MTPQRDEPLIRAVGEGRGRAAHWAGALAVCAVLALLTPPISDVLNGLGPARAAVALFAFWAVLILCAGLLSRTLRRTRS